MEPYDQPRLELLLPKEAEESAEKSTVKTSDKIPAAIRSNPTVATPELAQLLGLSMSGVEKQLAKLKTAGRLRLTPPDPG